MLNAPVAPRGRRSALAAAPFACGVALAALASVQLARALPWVANRHAFGWDSARRAALDVQAADALRHLDLPSFLWYLAGPETWPTLRLALAAPLHAMAGPGRALAVEHGLSLALAAALAVGLAFAARRIAPSAGGALLVLAVAAAGLAGNRMLLTFAADGMLEVPSALLTLAATGAWIHSRERDTLRPWPVALLGNLLFHVKWQHGLFFAAAALALEATRGGVAPVPRRARALLTALREGAGTRGGAALLATAAALAAAALWVAATGGGEGRVLGVRFAMRGAHGPAAFGALALFAFVEVALWRARARLALELPERLRYLWTWLATPMAAWLLVPFSRRLRTLTVTAASYDSGEAPASLAGRSLYYLRGAWEGWAPSGAREVLAVLLVATTVAAVRSPQIRRRMAPIAALVAVEWLALTVLSRHNYQARFVANLAPLACLAAAAWIPTISSPTRRAALALCAAAALALPAVRSWRTEPLAAILSGGFDPADNGDACRSVAQALPVGRAVLVNEAPMSHRQGCMLWALLTARERGAQLKVGAEGPLPGWDEAIALADGCSRLPVLPGFAPAGPPAQAGPVCGQRYDRVAAAAR